MRDTTYDLVVLAAGIGSRFGGLKQVQPVGPAGELIIEYSAFDGLRAGFGRLVLVIRRDIENEFRALIGRRLEARMDVRYVFQNPDDLPAGCTKPAERAKPWGTGHAVLAARGIVDRPFAAINADDFYGGSAYRTLANHFAGSVDYAMVGYPLRQTLSEHGTVSRGLCGTDERGALRRIAEITGIQRNATGARYTDADGTTRELTGDETVSMNFWGFRPDVFDRLERLFAGFLAARGTDPKAEFYLPTAISTLIERDGTGVALLRSEDSWFGMTYREDIATTRAALRDLTAAGRYPTPLWS